MSRTRVVFLGAVVGVVALATLVTGLAVSTLLPAERAERARFDPAEVARLETAMWRAYYEHRWVRLYFLGATMLRAQHHVGPVAAYLGAWDATHAARLFRRGLSAEDYRRALPSLDRYYRRLGTVPEEHLAERELAWWIVHRESGRGGAPPALETLPAIAPHEPLVVALASASAAFYRVPMARVRRYAEERARAMRQRDGFAADGRALAEADWAVVEATLGRAYRELHAALNP